MKVNDVEKETVTVYKVAEAKEYIKMYIPVEAEETIEKADNLFDVLKVIKQFPDIKIQITIKNIK